MMMPMLMMMMIYDDADVNTDAGNDDDDAAERTRLKSYTYTLSCPFQLRETIYNTINNKCWCPENIQSRWRGFPQRTSVDNVEHKHF